MVGEPGSGPAAEVLRRLDCVEYPVHIYRDEWGIPHIRAQSGHDAFVGQGYAHAMDRLWQMDASRKQMQGRWAEWVGAPGVAADMLARRLQVSAASMRDYAALGPEARAMVDAYTAGVNAYLDTHPDPAEYKLLETAPEPWEGWHCIAAMRQRGYLMGSVWFKLWRAAAVGILGPQDIAKLRYDDGGLDRLCIPPGADASRWIAGLTDLREPIEALSLLPFAAEVQGGSNNWAVAPDRTTTGRALLAGDPHRAFELPGMYAQLHLRCDQFDAIGLTVPGVPGLPHFGHNGQVAWCVTHAFADIHDLYVEQFDRADPARYRYQDDWLTAATTTEEIKVRDAGAVRVQITETIHGPVVAGDPASGAALTLKSVQFFDVDRSFDCLLPMLRAGSVDALFGAVRGWGLIDHNLVAGDVAGHIGHLVRAVIPRRSAVNGWLPVPGWTGSFEWDGTVAAEEMPRVDDPARGYLVTANNRVVSALDGAGGYFCTDTHPPYRARRIEELLDRSVPVSPADMAAIHHDDLSAPAQLFQAALADVIPVSAEARAVRDVLLAWDARMSPESVGATYYSRLRWTLSRMVGDLSGLAPAAQDTPFQLPGRTSAVSQLWWVLPALLRSGDVALTGGRSWPDLLAEALATVAGEAASEPWRDVHPAALSHPLTALIPAAPAALSRTGAGVGGDNETVWANGCRAESGTAAVYGAVARYVFDVGNWDACHWIVVGGSAGDPASPHYLDQHEAWSRCELIPMRYDWDVIAAVGEPLILQPGNNIRGAEPS
jgi:penicillin G amidase